MQVVVVQPVTVGGPLRAEHDGAKVVGRKLDLGAPPKDLLLEEKARVDVDDDLGCAVEKLLEDR